MKTILLALILILVIAAVVIFILIPLLFDSKDHSEYDSSKHSLTSLGKVESPEHAAATKELVAGMAEMTDGSKLDRKQALALMRRQMDERGASRKIGSQIYPVDSNGVKGEWVVAANADPKRRLFYIHGGGYVMGSPQSHRPITSRLSEISGAAVLAIDYRLQPEHSRMAGIEDCRTAYRWILKNGPASTSEVQTLIIAGDSAGGNLALSTIAWARDSGLRAAEAVVAFSPQTDATLASPSLVNNIDTDVMQGRTFGPVVKAPRAIYLGINFLMNRINPNNPIVSPLLGELSNLPPLLIQVSESEMFLDDAVRYVNKANAQGSKAELQTWSQAMHVWQAFQVPEADEAFEKVEAFLRQHAN